MHSLKISTAAMRLEHLKRLSLLALLALVALLAVTWRLWTPLRDVPRLPTFDFLQAIPATIDWFWLIMLAYGLFVFVSAKSEQRPTTLPFICLAGLMLFDQLRWQAWAWHLLLVGIATSLSRPSNAMRWLRWLTISIYLYSAIAKLDYTFAATMGQQLLGVITGWLGWELNDFALEPRIGLALLLPLGELLIGGLLIFSKTKRLGVGLAITLHTANLLLLGPLGLHHQWGVLLWNIYFAGSVWLLFGVDIEEETHVARLKKSDWLLTAGLAIALIGPALRPLGFWDAWPGWALYAPGGPQADVLVHRRVVDRLPETIPLSPATSTSPWRKVKLGEWMLNETGAPLAPTPRVRIALGKAIDQEFRLGDYLQIETRSAANWKTGDRTTSRLAMQDKER